MKGSSCVQTVITAFHNLECFPGQWVWGCGPVELDMTQNACKVCERTFRVCVRIQMAVHDVSITRSQLLLSAYTYWP